MRHIDEMLADTCKDLAATMTLSAELLPLTMFDFNGQPLTESLTELMAGFAENKNLVFMGMDTADGDLAGYAAVCCMGEGIGYLMRLYVKPEYRGHGLGSDITKETVKAFKSLTLVCTDSLIPFYEKAGLTFRGYYDRKDPDHTINDSAFLGLAMMGNGNTRAILRLLDTDIMPHVVSGVSL